MLGAPRPNCVRLSTKPDPNHIAKTMHETLATARNAEGATASLTRRRGADTARTQMGRPTYEAPTREYTHKHTHTQTNTHDLRPDKVRCGHSRAMVFTWFWTVLSGLFCFDTRGHPGPGVACVSVDHSFRAIRRRDKISEIGHLINGPKGALLRVGPHRSSALSPCSSSPSNSR